MVWYTIYVEVPILDPHEMEMAKSTHETRKGDEHFHKLYEILVCT